MRQVKQYNKYYYECIPVLADWACHMHVLNIISSDTACMHANVIAAYVLQLIARVYKVSQNCTLYYLHAIIWSSSYKMNMIAIVKKGGIKCIQNHASTEFFSLLQFMHVSLW